MHPQEDTDAALFREVLERTLEEVLCLGWVCTPRGDWSPVAVGGDGIPKVAVE